MSPSLSAQCSYVVCTPGDGWGGRDQISDKKQLPTERAYFGSQSEGVLVHVGMGMAIGDMCTTGTPHLISGGTGNEKQTGTVARL